MRSVRSRHSPPFFHNLFTALASFAPAAPIPSGRQLQSSQQLPVLITFPQTYIHKYFTNLSAGAICLLVFCISLGLVVAVGTGIDIKMQWKLTQAKKEPLVEGRSLSLSEEKPPREPTAAPRPFLTDLLLCFSLYTNVPKLFSARSSGRSDPLELLNGVRVMSMGWVILGHCYLYHLTYSCIKNFNDILPIIKEVKTIVVVNGQFAVDAFFWMSGFLMGVLLLGQLVTQKRMGLWGWVYLYLHRLYRILPAYMFVLFLMWAFLKYSGNGPLWFSADQFNDPCHDYWWTNLIFMNNFIPDGHGNTCIGHSWYLANDMQFFWISPPIFFLYFSVHRICGWILIAALWVTAILCNALISSHYDYNAITLAPEDGTYFNNVYSKPYCRVAAYAFGIAAGFVLFSYRRFKSTGEVFDPWALKIGTALDNKWVRHTSVIFGLFLINFFMFVLYNAAEDADNGWQKWTKAENVLYLTFYRPCFSLGLTLVLLPMLQGHYRIGIWFLSLPVWTPFARLTFCTYLIHISLIVSYYFSAQTAFWLNDLNIVTDFLFILLIAYAAAVPISLAVESPCMAFEKLLKSRRSKPRNNN